MSGSYRKLLRLGNPNVIIDRSGRPGKDRISELGSGFIVFARKSLRRIKRFGGFFFKLIRRSFDSFSDVFFLNVHSVKNRQPPNVCRAV